MAKQPLPATVHVQRAAADRLTLSGTLALARLTRLAGRLASLDGAVAAECAFSYQDIHRDARGGGRCAVVTVTVDARLTVQCQRCLEAVTITLRGGHPVGVVADDAAAKRLPANLEPWLVERDPADLWALVEDELLLSLPIVNYHEPGQCGALAAAIPKGAPPDSPFKVLEQLKSGR